MPLFFNGKWWVKPQAIAQIDDSQMNASTLGNANSIAIIGQALGGKPLEVTEYSNSSVATSVLRGGDLLRAMRLAWTPSSVEAGAGTIKSIRVNSATQSTNTTDLKDVDAVVVLHDQSKDYGVWTKKIEPSFDFGTASKISDTSTASEFVAALRIISVGDSIFVPSNATYSCTLLATDDQELTWKDGTAVAIAGNGTYILPSGDTSVGDLTISVSSYTGITSGLTSTIVVEPQGVSVMVNYAVTGIKEFQDNLGPVMSIRYTGDGSSATLSVVAGVFNVVVAGAADGSSSLTIDLTEGNVDTIVELVNYINGQTGYVCELSEYLLNPGLNSAMLDDVTGVAIKGNTRILRASLETIVDWSKNYSILNEFTYPSTIVSRKPLNVSSATVRKFSLDGGSEGSNTIAQWMEALALLEAEDVNIIVPITIDPAIQALVIEHVTNMSNNKKRRRTYLGHPVDASIRDIQNLKTSLSSNKRVSLVSPTVKLRDDKGVVTVYDSSFRAAMNAGMVAGFSNPAMSLTGKYTNEVGLGKSYLSTEIDSLLTSGISVTEFVKNKGNRITWGRTTYTLDDKSINVEDSVSRTADFIAGDLESSIEDAFTGKTANIYMISSIAAFVQQKMESYEAAGMITGGTDPVTNQSVPSFRNIKVTFSNGVCNIYVEASIVEPINFEPITISFRPVNISA